MRLHFTRTATAAIGAVAMTILAGCGGSGTESDTGGSSGSSVSVVASTNVWGSVVAAVGGADVSVKSIIEDPTSDPHSYQLTARDTATMTGADLVVFNGGGYDEFVEQALEVAGDDGPDAVTAFEVFEELDAEPHGFGQFAAQDTDEHAHEENEHVWYHLPTVAAVAELVAERLGEIRPESASTFQANADAFGGQVEQLHEQVEALAEAHDGAEVAATEPLAHYLLEDAGLHDATPESFVEAIELETDPPAAAVAEIQALVGARRVAVLVHNPQTETPVVADVVSKADQAGLPVVEMTETLPPGQDYVTWMTGQIEALSAALSG